MPVNVIHLWKLYRWWMKKGKPTMWALIDGKKLYIVGSLMMLTGLSKMGLDLLNGQPVNEADWKLTLEGFAIIGGKSALRKLES